MVIVTPLPKTHVWTVNHALLLDRDNKQLVAWHDEDCRVSTDIRDIALFEPFVKGELHGSGLELLDKEALLSSELYQTYLSLGEFLLQYYLDKYAGGSTLIVKSYT